MGKSSKTTNQRVIWLEEVHQLCRSDSCCGEEMSPVAQHQTCPLVSGQHHVASGPHRGRVKHCRAQRFMILMYIGGQAQKESIMGQILSLCHKDTEKGKKSFSLVWVPWAVSLWHKRTGLSNTTWTSDLISDLELDQSVYLRLGSVSGLNWERMVQ